MKRILYLEINNTSLSLNVIKEKGDSYLIQNSESINLENLEFKDGIIYNPSKISSIVKNFLKTNGLKTMPATICIPNIEPEDIKQKLISLQNALCFGNAGLKIEKIINKPIFNKQDCLSSCKINDLKNQVNLFSPFLNQNKHPLKWITYSSVISILFFYVVVNLSNSQKIQTNQIESKNDLLSNANLDLKKEINFLNNMKNTNNELINRIEKLKSFKVSKFNTSNLLIHTALSMSPQSFLTKLSIKKDPTAKSVASNNQTKINNTSLNLTGITTNQNSITQLCNKLKTSNLIESVKQPNLKKLKTKKLSKNQPKEFTFEVSAVVKKQ